MVVIETKSQIMELGAHEMTLAQPSGTLSHSTNSERSLSFVNSPFVLLILN
jgi:hypothetical protein